MCRSNSGGPTSSTARPVSSNSSRRAASSRVSPSSTPPPGVSHHVPSSGRPGSKPRNSSTRPSGSITSTRAASRTWSRSYGHGSHRCPRRFDRGDDRGDRVAHAVRVARDARGVERRRRRHASSTCSRSRSSPASHPVGSVLDPVRPQAIGRLDPVEVRRGSARRARLPAGCVVWSKRSARNTGRVDHEPLRGRVRTTVRFVGEQPHLDRVSRARADRPAPTTGTRAPPRSRTRRPAASASPSIAGRATVRERPGRAVQVFARRACPLVQARLPRAAGCRRRS